jgi:sugar phosphate isomerase/epimerase
MNNENLICRRRFVHRLAVAGTAMAAAAPVLDLAAAAARPRWPVIAFSKAFQSLSFAETAALVAEVGWDGIECPVRPGGQVLPERVTDDLPRLADEMKKCGVAVHIITTNIVKVQEPTVEKVLRTAVSLGIRHYRMGPIKYLKDQPIPRQLQELKPAFRDLAAMNRDLGICGGYQNHSGSDNVGAAVWDIYELIKDLDPKFLGTHFDIAHATIEGGLIWPVHAQLMLPFFSAVYVKDFTWGRDQTQWRVQWCPLGQGMINRSYFETLKASGFAGPISQHHEYALGNKAAMTAAFKKDRAELRRWLEQ